jgi:hypothetical protein
LLEDDAVPARAKPRVESAEEDVRHIERSERALLEDRLELIAVARSPMRRIATDQE